MLHQKTCQHRDSSQLQVMDLLYEWCVVHIRDVGESYLFAGLNTPPLRCYSLTRVSRPGPLKLQSSRGFSILPGRKLLHQGKLDPRWCLCVRGRAENPMGSRIGSRHPAITEGSAMVVCSATAYKAQRLWDTSACSATAALITAETLTVCHVSMLGPHSHSHPKNSDIFLLGKRSVCIFVYRTFQGELGWAEWVYH